MQLSKIGETATTITLGWTPVAGADGYRFYSAGVLRSKTMDPSRKSVKFSKGQEPYKVEAVVLTPIDSGVYPSTPVTFKKVAPRVAYKQDGSDARYCLWAGAEGGALRPGLSYIDPNNHSAGVRDEVAQYSLDGLCLGSERTGGKASDGIVGAKEIDGRPLCSLPMPGDPTRNTGSWLI
jgi:hypothetical protein